MLAMLAFGNPEDIGYDPTFTFSPVVPRPLSATKKLNLGMIEVDSVEYAIVHCRDACVSRCTYTDQDSPELAHATQHSHPHPTRTRALQCAAWYTQ